MHEHPRTARTAHPRPDGAPSPTPSGSERRLQTAFAVGYAAVFLLGLRGSLVPEEHRSDASMITYTLLFAVGVLAWRGALLTGLRRIASRKRRALGALALGIVGLVVLETAGGLLAQWLSQSVGAQELGNDTRVSRVLDLYPPVVVIAVLAVMGPVVEELFFRQLLIPRLSRLSRPWVAVAVSSLMFGALHMSSTQASEWIGVIPHTCFGVAMGVLFVRTRYNIVFPVIIHVLVNLSAFLGEV